MKLTTEDVFKNAVAAHKQGNLKVAEDLYTSILHNQPLHPDANHNLGILLASLNNTASALPLLKTALECKPEQEQFWISYIHLLIKENQIEDASKIFEEGKTKGIIQDKYNKIESEILLNLLIINPIKSSTKLDKIIKNEKNKIKYQVKKISKPTQLELNDLLEKYQVGKYDLAKEQAINLTIKYPEHHFGWKVLGALFKNIGNLEKSVFYNLKAIQFYPNDADTYYNLSSTLQALNKLYEAEISLKKAIVLNPNFAEANYNLGLLLQGLNRLNEAEKAYRKAIEINPGYLEALCNLGSTLKKIGKNHEAENYFRKIISFNENFYLAHFNLGVTLQELNRFEEAEISYKKALELKPDFAEAHCNLGNILQELSRLQESEISYRKAISIDPNFAEAYCNLGNTLKELNRRIEAELNYRKAIEINPNFSDAHCNLGLILKEMLRIHEAEKCLQIAIELNPDSQNAISGLGKLLIEKNQHIKGLNMINRVCGYIHFDVSSGLTIK